jgi:cell division protein ZapA (FtsZ GTPase activity inhibitor)
MKPARSSGVHTVEVLGRTLRLSSDVSEPELRAAIEALESAFAHMDEASRVKWGHARAASDTSTWLLMGALNLAHRVARLEREANQHTQDLEQTLKLLDDVPDDIQAAPPLNLFPGGLPS